MNTILIVDDDAHIRDVVRFALEQAGMRVVEAADGEEALAQARAQRPDLIVLDILMPEMDGLEVCRRLRKHDETPILFLSSRGDEIDRVIGLEIGGDDYVTKPFSPRELVARVNVILRRIKKIATAPDTPDTLDMPDTQNTEEAPLVRGNLRLDIHSHVVSWKEEDVALTATEFSLLKTFLRHPTKAYTRDELMDQAYDQDVTVSDRTIDSHVRGVRSKVAARGGDNIIETVHGVGYKLGSCQ